MPLPTWFDARLVVFLAVLVVAAALILVLALTGNLEVAASTLGEWGQGLVGLAIGLFGGALAARTGPAS